MRAILVGTLAMGSLMSVGAYNPLYIQLIFHLGAAQSGLVMTPLAGGVIAGSILSGPDDEPQQERGKAPAHDRPVPRHADLCPPSP
ncbi:MAG: hypothetical protein WDN06_13300 [Asticcacaulis sp.]